jgi:hypothetical protein
LKVPDAFPEKLAKAVAMLMSPTCLANETEFVVTGSDQERWYIDITHQSVSPHLRRVFLPLDKIFAPEDGRTAHWRNTIVREATDLVFTPSLNDEVFDTRRQDLY